MKRTGIKFHDVYPVQSQVLRLPEDINAPKKDDERYQTFKENASAFTKDFLIDVLWATKNRYPITAESFYMIGPRAESYLLYRIIDGLKDAYGQEKYKNNRQRHYIDHLEVKLNGQSTTWKKQKEKEEAEKYQLLQEFPIEFRTD